MAHVSIRVGQGYDVHRLTAGRPLILGGVTVPYHLGLLGHSDADVLIHAVMDALMGAAGLGDIGAKFPDSDFGLKGISSMLLLGQTAQLLQEAGWQTVNVDATVIAQAPKLAQWLPEMSKNIALRLGVLPEQINIKATTEEGLGFTGTGEGMAAQAVALIEHM